jgi:ribosomal protein S18 acetylase RimI-like enzyme
VSALKSAVYEIVLVLMLLSWTVLKQGSRNAFRDECDIRSIICGTLFGYDILSSKEGHSAMQISDMSLDDANDVVDIQRVVWLDTFPNPDFGITREDIEKKLKVMAVGGVERLKKHIHHAEKDGAHFWVAKSNKKVVGFIRAEKHNDRNRIRVLLILHEYQKRGIGKKLMKKALSWLGNEKDIVLNVVSYNINAIGFYKALGFVKGDPTYSEVAKLPSGKVLPEIEMIKPKPFN